MDQGFCLHCCDLPIRNKPPKLKITRRRIDVRVPASRAHSPSVTALTISVSGKGRDENPPSVCCAHSSVMITGGKGSCCRLMLSLKLPSRIGLLGLTESINSVRCLNQSVAPIDAQNPRRPDKSPPWQIRIPDSIAHEALPRLQWFEIQRACIRNCGPIF